MPEYEFMFWNEGNTPMDSEFVRSAYAEKKFAFVSDYVRFWVLNKYGGIYLDTDMFVLRSFSPLLESSVLFGWETSQKNTVSCGVIGSCPGHAFIGSVLAHYDSLKFNTDKIPDLVIPRIITKCFSDYNPKSEITILPYDYFYPFPYEEKENKTKFLDYKTENTYAIHLWSVSWGTVIHKIRDYLIYYYLKICRGRK